MSNSPECFAVAAIEIDDLRPGSGRAPHPRRRKYVERHAEGSGDTGCGPPKRKVVAPAREGKPQ